MGRIWGESACKIKYSPPSPGPHLTRFFQPQSIQCATDHALQILYANGPTESEDEEADNAPQAMKVDEWSVSAEKHSILYHVDASENLTNVRAWLAFHAAPSEAVARQILLGNFAILQQLDDGFIGQGIYVTTDAAYAIVAPAGGVGPSWAALTDAVDWYTERRGRGGPLRLFCVLCSFCVR